MHTMLWLSNHMHAKVTAPQLNVRLDALASAALRSVAMQGCMILRREDQMKLARDWADQARAPRGPASRYELLSSSPATRPTPGPCGWSARRAAAPTRMNAAAVSGRSAKLHGRSCFKGRSRGDDADRYG
eukprot:5618197-Pleurochrysis_carterae.AAC.3